jgi:hypothetical protein
MNAENTREPLRRLSDGSLNRKVMRDELDSWVDEVATRTPSAKAVLHVLAHHADAGTFEVWCSVRTMIDDSQFSETVIDGILCRLVQDGLVLKSKERRRQGANGRPGPWTYTLAFDPQVVEIRRARKKAHKTKSEWYSEHPSPWYQDPKKGRPRGKKVRRGSKLDPHHSSENAHYEEGRESKLDSHHSSERVYFSGGRGSNLGDDEGLNQTLILSERSDHKEPTPPTPTPVVPRVPVAPAATVVVVGGWIDGDGVRSEEGPRPLVAPAGITSVADAVSAVMAGKVTSPSTGFERLVEAFGRGNSPAKKEEARRIYEGNRGALDAISVGDVSLVRRFYAAEQTEGQERAHSRLNHFPPFVGSFGDQVARAKKWAAVQPQGRKPRKAKLEDEPPCDEWRELGLVLYRNTPRYDPDAPWDDLDIRFREGIHEEFKSYGPPASAATELPTMLSPDEPTELSHAVAATPRAIIDPPSEDWRDIAETSGWLAHQFGREWEATPPRLKEEVWDALYARSDTAETNEDASLLGCSCLPVT